MRGDLDSALGLAQRNYELTERLGDVFSRHWALFNLGFVRLERGDAEGALDSLERADRLYRQAMGDGGEAETWREALIAEALVGVGRVPEGLERAECATAIVRERGLLWGLPRALRTLAQARIAAGEPGAGRASRRGREVGRGQRSGCRVERDREGPRLGPRRPGLGSTPDLKVGSEGRGTTLVPTATSNVSRTSTTVGGLDDLDAHGHIYMRVRSAGGRKVASQISPPRLRRQASM